MACITSRPQVVEIQPQVGTSRNRNLVVSMKVALASSKCPSQRIQDQVSRRSFQAHLAELFHDLRFPATIHTPPAVALEAQNPELAVAGIVPAFNAGAAAFVMVALPCAAVLFAGSTGSECGTARGRAGAEYAATRSRKHRGLSHCP
jgi:hypothetical protein